MLCEEREAKDARGDLGRDLNVGESPEPIESPRWSSSVPPPSRQSWEERPTKRVGANEWNVNSTPISLPVLDVDQTVPMMLHTSSAHEGGNAPLCEVCQAPSCREHTTGDNSVCPPYGQHNHQGTPCRPHLEDPQRGMGTAQPHRTEALEVS